MKWTKAEYGNDLRAGNFAIKKSKDKFMLYLGWNMIAFLSTVEGCKRVANCLSREMKRDRERA